MVLVCTAMGTTFVAQTLLLLAVPLFALRLGATPASIGVLVSAPFFLPALFAIPMGRLVTRFGAKRVMAVGALGMAVGPFAAIAFPVFAGLLAMQIVIGTMQVTMGISAQSTVASLGRGKQLERYFGWYTTSVAAGQMFGPVIGGVLIDAFSPTAAFMVASVIPLMAFACTRGLNVPGGVRTPGEGSPLGYASQVRLLRTSPAVQIAVLVTVAVLFAFGAHAAFFPVYLEGLAVPASLIGALVSLRALSSTLVRPFMAAAIRALGGRSRTVLVCVGLIAVGIGLTGTTTLTVLLAGLAVMIGVGSGLAQPLTMVAIADHVEARERPSALGLRLTSNQAAQVAGPLALGVVAEAFGLTLMFAVGGLVLIGVLAWIVRIVPAYDRMEGERTASPPS